MRGKITGVDNVYEAEERLANAIADTISPTLLPDVEISTVDGKSLLLVRVVHWPGPFHLKSKTDSKEVYVRLGSTNRVASPEIVFEMERTISKQTFDQQPCFGTTLDSLDRDAIAQLFKQEVENTHLETLGILTKHHGQLVCSNGGIILFGNKDIRDRLFPNATVRCARFRGVNKVDFIDQYTVEGSIIDAMTEVPKFIKRNTRLAAKIESIHRQDIPEYPPVAVREVLTNALVHADYSIKGMQTRLAIYADRLEIESPGMLPFGYTIDDFFAGVSHVRNKVIARVFREVGLMEEWGTGYRRISQVCKEGGYPLPSWHELGTGMRVSFAPHNETEDTPSSSEELTFRQEQILTILESGQLTAKEILALIKPKVSERMLRNDLQALKIQNRLTTTGRGPSTRWKLAK